MTSPQLPPLPDDLQARLAAAGVTDDASLRAALERDPQLRADLETFLASPAGQTMLINALLAAFVAMQDPDQLREFWRAVPAEMEQPFIEAVERLLAEAPADADPAALDNLRAKLADFKQLCQPAAQPDAPPLVQALQDFVGAPSWAESQRIVEQHPRTAERRCAGAVGARDNCCPHPGRRLRRARVCRAPQSAAALPRGRRGAGVCREERPSF